MSPRRYRITINERAYEVEVGSLYSSPISVIVDGTEYTVEVPDRPANGVMPGSVNPPARSQPISEQSARPPQGAPADGANSIIAMMPGRVISVGVKAGQEVKRGQPVCVIESMKMEQTMSAPRDGRVSSVSIAPGDTIQRGQALVDLD